MSPPEMLSVKRNASFSQHHFAQLLELKENTELTDFRILCNGKVLDCHRVVLAAASPMLRTMMVTHMQEASTSEVNLDCIPYNILTSIIGYMYTGEIALEAGDLHETLEACNYLMLEDLKQFCIQKLPSSIKPENVLSWIKFANELQMEDILAKCKAILLSSFAEQTSEEGCLALYMDKINECIKQAEQMEASGNDVLDAMMSTGELDKSTEINNFKDLLNIVKLEQCDVERLKSVIEQYDEMANDEPNFKRVLSKAVIHVCECVITPPVCLLMTGGETTKKLWILDEDNEFSQLSQLPKEAQCKWQSICEAPEGIIFSGGANSTVCMMFVFRTKSWKKLPDLRLPRSEHGSVVVDGCLVILGGRHSMSDRYGKKMEILSSITDGEWGEGPDADEILFYPKLAAIGHDLYALSQDSMKLYCMDMAATEKTWVSLPTLFVRYAKSARYCSMLAIDDKLFVAGGLGLCAWYYPSTRAWCLGKVSQVVHHYPGMAVYGGKVMLLGGHATDVVEEYDKEKDEWNEMDIEVPWKMRNMYAFAVHMER